MQGLQGLTEQTGEQRDKGCADQHHPAASHELLDPLRLRARIIVSVALHEVDDALHRKTGSESNDEGLENRNRLIDKCHKVFPP